MSQAGAPSNASLRRAGLWAWGSLVYALGMDIKVEQLPRDFIAASHVARVAELADAYGSGPYGETRGGSSPLVSTAFSLVEL